MDGSRSNGPQTFGDLLGGIAEEVFFTDYYCRRPLHVEADDSFEPSISFDEIEQYLLAAPYPSAKVIVLHWGDQRRLAQNKSDVLNNYRDGSTFIIQDADLAFPNIVPLVADVERSFGELATANLYVSPAEQPGFARHYDTHDVVVLQLHGKKTWKIFENTDEYPLWEQHDHQLEVPDEEALLQSVEMSPGDLLYLPRGYWHEALASSDSVHLTVGVHQATASTFLTWLADDVRSDPALRAPFVRSGPGPRSYRADALPSGLREHWAEMAHAIAERLEDGGSVERFIRETVAIKDRRIAPRLKSFALLSAEEQDGITIKLGSHCQPWIEEDSETIVLLAADRQVKIPMAYKSALELVVAGSPFRIRDLVDAGISDVQARSLVDKLDRLGLLSVCL